jgi:hypothetical protein
MYILFLVLSMQIQCRKVLKLTGIKFLEVHSWCEVNACLQVYKAARLYIKQVLELHSLDVPVLI